MQVINKQFKTINELREYRFPPLSLSNTLIQVWTGYYSESEVIEIYEILTSQNFHFIGTTTAGEIFQGKYSVKSIVISISIFENSRVNISHFIERNDYQTGIKVAKTMATDLTKILILFGEGLRTNGDDLVQGIASVNSNIVIAGGMAGDYGDMKKTFVFDHNGIYDRGVVVASINSEVLQVFTDYQLNWQPIGKVMTVTKANKNILYEIDNMNVKDLYRKYLGEKIADLFPISAIEFPLVKIGEQGMLLGRDILMALDDGGFITAGNLEVGDKVRFSFGNVD
ncbi:MAG TPA: diguanylate phosphodiesterase, partial [Campylobacterales bacterium]|nr:diguanylate phosphodiesterase [Campylobacterales bacterium]